MNHPSISPAKQFGSARHGHSYSTVFTPRPYQIELVEHALKQNTITCLNSSSGKSFVWMTYLREIMGQNFNASRPGGLEANAFILFSNDAIVKDSGSVLENHMDLAVAVLRTEQGLSLAAKDWKVICRQNKVIVTSPRVLSHALTNSLLDCQQISVLIADECHTILEPDGDLSKIMKVIDEANTHPYVLGLTSSLLKEDSSAQQLENDIKTMENLLHCKAETATDLIAMDGCSPTQPDEKIVLCGVRTATSVTESEDKFAKDLRDPSCLSAEIRSILLPAIAWLKVCNINSRSTCTKAIVGVAGKCEADETVDCGEHGGSSKSALEPDHTSSPEAEKAGSATGHADVDAFVRMSLTVLSQILLVLDVLGLWCAHRLVILLLKQLQKTLSQESQAIPNCKDMASKWRYFFLRYTDSHLRAVYTLCQTNIRSQKKVDMKLVTPKVNRLLQVLKEYRPPVDSEKRSENQKTLKFNDRSEAGYVSWWQDSDAEEDDEETQMMMEGNKKNEAWGQKDEADPEAKTGVGKTARPFHHANSLCGIVFVKEKYVAVMLQRLLKEVSKEDSDLWHVSSAHITSLVSPGQNLSEVERNEITQDVYNSLTSAEKQKQEEALRNFRSHEINLLVATNCLEEYAEIPKCNLVLRFDVPNSYKSYVLSKSRARSTNSAYMMLVDDVEKAEFMSRLQEYKKIEKVLQHAVYDNSANKGPPADFDYLDVAESDSDDEYELAKVPPYYSGPNTCVTIDSAIHIVNRYCSRLPSDPFTHLSPRCEIIQVSDAEANVSSNPLYKCILQLPINSHCRKPIMGIPMSTTLLAQKAVALEACRMLHKSRELDDHFMPIGKEMVKYAEELDPWPEEKSSVPGRPGTTKRRQTYDKQIPETLSNCLPRSEVPLFLYEIEMKLRSRMPDELNVRRRKLHAPEETTRCFGILTTKALPSLLGFPIFTRSGEEFVQIRLCRSFITLGEHHIKMIHSFHYYIFSDMLRIDRVPLSFKPNAAPMQIYAVILNESSHSHGLDIDWKFMCKVAAKRRVEDRKRSDPWFRHRMQEATGGKNVFVFKRSKYEDGVVVAKYRSPDQPNRFYVAEIKDDLDPYSSFPSSEYESFHSYYRIKYGLDISCLNQPLLDVDHTSSRLNLLTPRYMNQKGKVLPTSNLEKKRAKYETLTNRQILVPELCDLHPIPASLWRKAVCLPSILYRLSGILVAEELRQKIFKDSNIGQGRLPLGQTWPDLTFGWDNALSFLNKLPNNFFNAAEDRLASSFTKDNHNPLIQTNPMAIQTESTAEILNGVHALENNTQSDGLTPDPDSMNHDTQTAIADPNPTDSDSIASAATQSDCGNDNKNGNLKNEESMNGIAEENGNSTSSDLDSDYDTDEYVHAFDLSDSEVTEKSPSKRNDRIRKRKSESPPLRLAELPANILQAPSQHHKGPSPGLILQALTLSNASDGFNLERLEMLGDSFLKHAVTVYLFCTYPDAHEGKLSYMRSKKVSNYNLYRIGQQKNLPGKMTALIFDPAVNWLPPGYIVGSGPSALEDIGILDDSRHDSLDDEMEIGVWTGVPGQKVTSPKPEKADTSKKSPVSKARPEPESDPQTTNHLSEEEEDGEEDEIFDEDEIQMIDNMLGGCLVGGVNGLRGSSHSSGRRQNGLMRFVDRGELQWTKQQHEKANDTEFVIDTWTPVDADGKPLCASDPLLIDLHTQHSLADKSIADCVEAILGSYLTTCGHRAAQLLLCYFGLKVLPKLTQGKHKPDTVPLYGYLKQPENVLLDDSTSGRTKLDLFAKDLESFETKIGYTFKNKSYLLQAFTHASYYLNTITDCYQRLEFLGDAILDFLITCRLFNDPSRRHSPGALTDLRSALVNNTIFASLAVRHDFHKYFKAVSPELHHIIDGFVRYQHLQEEAQGMDAQLAKQYYAMADSGTAADELEDAIVPPGAIGDPEEVEEEEEEDVEVPKALGDIFESVAGAIYMDSGMNLDEVWRVYEPMMNPLIEKFSSCVPRAPVRELLEMEPETAKFSWAEKRCDGKVRVTVEVIGKGSFKGVGRSYRIAKSAAARRALRFLKSSLNED